MKYIEDERKETRQLLLRTQTSPSLDEKFAKAGRRRRARRRFTSLLFPSHGPLRLDTSLSRFALASMQIRSAGGGGGRENPLFQMKITKTEMLFSWVYLRIVK